VSPLVELTLAVLLATGAVYFVLRPIFRVTASVVEGDEGDESEEDLSPRAVALRALKEIEFDRATGKLSDADYDALKNQYTGMALDALREAGPSHAFPHPASPIPHPACPIHGPSSEIGARFCPECGRRLSAAHGIRHDARGPVNHRHPRNRRAVEGRGRALEQLHDAVP